VLSAKPSRSMRCPRTRCRVAALGMMAILLGGCQGLSYYAQAVAGQVDLLARRRPIEALLGDPGTDPLLKHRLARVADLRAFAAERLRLPVDGVYTSYADLDRPYAVWVVFAAPPFDLAARTWCFPVVGCVAYLGYFDEDGARRRARRLEAEGLETYVTGARAYSTLGWFDDPVLNTFVDAGAADLAGLVFHELAHRKLYVNDDSVFNESFAVAVEREGVRRWLRQSAGPDAVAAYERGLARRDAFTDRVLACRARLAKVYARRVPPEAMAREKAAVVALLRAEYRSLKVSWGGYDAFDPWMSGPLNNAQLNSLSTYHSLRPGFTGLLARCDGDLERFYADCRELADVPLEERHARLRALAADGPHAAASAGRVDTRATGG